MAPTAKFYNIPDGLSAISQVPGSRFEGEIEISLDHYQANGMTVASLVASLPLTTVTHFIPSCLGPTLDSTVNDFSYDRANGKVKLYNATTEVSDNTDVSAYKLYAHVGGRR